MKPRTALPHSGCGFNPFPRLELPPDAVTPAAEEIVSGGGHAQARATLTPLRWEKRKLVN